MTFSAAEGLLKGVSTSQLPPLSCWPRQPSGTGCLRQYCGLPLIHHHHHHGRLPARSGHVLSPAKALQKRTPPTSHFTAMSAGDRRARSSVLTPRVESGITGNQSRMAEESCLCAGPTLFLSASRSSVTRMKHAQIFHLSRAALPSPAF